MKNFTFSMLMLFALVSFPAQAQITYADFDGTDMTFTSWGNAGFAKVANPDASGINTSVNVGEFSHAGDNWWTGIGNEVALTDFIDFSATPYFRMKVYAENPIYILFKLENFADSNLPAAEVGYQLMPEETNKWVELVFNFSDATPVNLNKIVLFFDPGQEYSIAGTKYYFDDITASDVAPQPRLTYSPQDGETDVQLFANSRIESNFALRMIDDSPIADPSSVVSLRKSDANGVEVPFSATISDDNKTIDITPDQLLEAGTTYWFGVVENTIEYKELDSPVSNVSASFTTRANPPSMITYNDFDGTSESAVVEALGDPAGLLMDNAMDPVVPSNTVVQWEKGASWWGWERIHIELNEPIDVSDDKVFQIRVYSPKETYVRFKVSNESGDAGLFQEIDADVTKVNEWQTLYFNFSDFEPADYKHLFIFIDGGNTEANTFYVDDIKGPGFSSSTAIMDIKNQQEYSVWPNPATDFIILSNTKGDQEVVVYNAGGALVKSGSLTNGMLSVSDLKPGVYFIRIGENTARFIKK